MDSDYKGLAQPWAQENNLQRQRLNLAKVTYSSDSGIPGLRACIPEEPSIGGRDAGVETKVLMGKLNVLGLAEEGNFGDT